MVRQTRIETAFLALGSNLGDRAHFIRSAIQAIGEIPETKVREKSDIIETPPAGVPDAQPNFLNGVVLIETELQPVDLMEKLQIIERRFGRTTKGDFKSRPIDIDILSYGNAAFIGKNLVIPHPRMHERRFVLEPLAQLAPDWMHPKLNRTARELLEELNGHRNDA